LGYSSVSKKNLLIRGLLGLTILTIVIYSIDLNLIPAFKKIEHYYFLVIALFFPLLINPIISNYRWKIILNAQGIDERFFSLVRITFISTFVGLPLPSSTGSDAIRIFISERRNRKREGAGGAAVIIDRLIGFYILSLLGIIGSLYLISKGMSFNLFYIVLFINISILFLFWIIKSDLIFSKIIHLVSRIKKLEPLTMYVSQLNNALNVFPYKRILLYIIPLIILFQLSTMFCGFLIFKSFGIGLPFFYHLAFLPLISIISIIPLSISGFGLREGGFVYFYGLLGVDSNILFLISLLYYFILTMIPAVIGMFYYVLGNNSFKLK